MKRKHKRRDAIGVIRKSKESLRTAQLGLADFQGDDPARRRTGLHNAIVFGRSVIHVVLTLRSIDADFFDTWYAPHRAEMEADLFVWFRELRNEILKEGAPEPAISMYVERLHLDQAQMTAVMKNKPPGATAFFIGDQVGGSGWTVELPDGSEEKYYVTLPETILRGLSVTVSYPNPPTSHLGEALADTSVNALLPTYLGYLARLVKDAERVFNSL